MACMATLQFWGVQGSYPGTYFSDPIGSNTSCVSIELKDSLLILDAGSGIRVLSQTLDMSKYDNIVLLLTHPHWDHIQGFPFFSSIYSKRNITLFSHKINHVHALTNQLNGYNFPLKKEDLPCTFTPTTDINALNKLIDTDIKMIPTNHQDCVGYRIIGNNCDATYIPDNQLHNPNITPFDDMVHFCKDTDILIHDSQYTNTDMPDKMNWGHSIYTDTLNLAQAANVQRFALFHHEPTRSVENLIEIENDCKAKMPGMDSFLAKEGMSIDLLGK